MHATRRILLASAFTIGTVGSASAQQMRAEVLHWWTSAGESAAVRVFAERFQAAGGTWVDTAIAGGANARTAGINRIVGGNPPTSMQFNTGKQFDELVANSLVRDLDAQAAAEKWASVIPAGIMGAVTRDGKVYAVPVNIHGQHWLFYNMKVLDAAGVAPPNSWTDVVASAEALRAKGIIPLAFSGQPNWERHLFNAVLSGHGGVELFRAVWGERDLGAVQSPKFLEVVELYGSLRKLVDPGSSGRNWNDATSLVITGKAAMQLMGDWAKGEFSNAGLVAGRDYGCNLLGQDGVFVMGGDVFVFPKTSQPDVLATQSKLVGVMLDPATQIAFNIKKGSVPVRRDVDVSSMDVCVQKGAAALADPKKQVEANELLSTPDLTGAVQDLITQYWNNPAMKPDGFVEEFVAVVQSAG